MRTRTDRKSTRLNSSHLRISYAVFCLKKKTHFAQVEVYNKAVQRGLLEKVAHTALASRETFYAPRAGRAILPSVLPVIFFFFNDTGTTEIYPLSLHDALPI